MKGRAYVMIFFFWALLTIITPMLVSWSQALKNLPPLSHDQGIPLNNLVTSNFIYILVKKMMIVDSVFQRELNLASPIHYHLKGMIYALIRVLSNACLGP